jgi:GT2 family glycosyltransferase
MDGYVSWPKRLIPIWNFLSRTRKWMAGSFIFCQADAFRELGGFSQDLFAAEEIEFSKRLKKLARARKKRVMILYRHPLLTSSRKAQLYTLAENWQVLRRTLLHRGQNLRERSNCGHWYDGRR